MAEASRRGKQKRKQVLKDELEKPTKEEYAVAKCLRFHATLNREGKFLGNNVPYFVGSRAVDILMDSKWSAKHDKSTALFTSRSSCQLYCERLLEKGFFHRAMKYEKRTDRKRKVKETTEKKAIKEDSKKSDKKSKKDETDDREKEEKDAKASEEKEKAKEDSPKPTDTEDKKRRKKKPKLDMHDNQLFIDGPDLYVWIYDPVPPKTFVIGLLLVFGAIAVCLFPLWPPEVRLCVYYLSVAAACFVGLIFILCILRIVIFAIVWLLTWGKLNFWLLPNLTEDVGFFDSFRPIYQCTFVTKSDASGEDAVTDGGDVKDETARLAETVDNGEEKSEELAEETGGAVADDDDDDVANSADDESANEDGDIHIAGDDVLNDEQSVGSNDNGYEMVSVEDVEPDNQTAEADDDDDDQNSQPTVRRRKGKSRLT